jgi:hypothetical protein
MTGTDVSLDQAEGNEFTVPVPVQGLVYTSYRVVCSGFVPVSGNISPYPAPGEAVHIPVTLIPEGVPSPVPAVIPETGNMSVPASQPDATPVPEPVNHTSEVILPAFPAVNLSVVSLPETTPAPVVVANGIKSDDGLNPAHVIRASSGPGGSIFPAGEVEVLDGGSVAFIMEPEGGHQIVYLVIDGITTGPMSEYRFINVTSDHTITAGYL